MRKRIGVFIGEIAQDYQRRVAQHLTQRANQLDYDVVFICSYGSYNEDMLYAEGEKACVYLPDCSRFDGIIVTEDLFDIDGMPDMLYKQLQETAKCPVVYLRTTRENCYSISIENTMSIASMVRHFTDDHGFTDICYMSGKKCAEDAMERLEGYLSVMKEKNIPVTEHMIFHGDYWRLKGKEAVDWFMEGRETYPQAIVCANDYMALSICEELRKRGVDVPGQVCVSGFDFIEEAKNNVPTLTSLEVDFETMIKRAVDTIDSVNRGEKQERVQRIPAKIRLHRSCGCGSQYRYKDIINLLVSKQQHVMDTKNSFISVTDYQYCFDYDEYMKIADKHRRFIKSPKSYFCFCDTKEKGFDDVENDSNFSNQMVLKTIFEDGKPAEKLDISFPRRKILPDEYWSDEHPNNYFVFSIHFKNIVYGYMVAEMPEGDQMWFDVYTQGYLMILANTIENGEIHRKMEHLESIRAIYQNDALTGILNRRGFDKMLQERYALAKEKGMVLGIASVDMDNLKTINDTYGHSEGDRSLITLAQALNSVMKEGDFCARVGGDEFAAVINVTHPGRCVEFKQELNAALKEKSAEITKYLVEASVGVCESNETGAASLVSCIQIADKRMYEEKRSRKVPR